MELWQAALLLLLTFAGIVFLVVLYRRRRKLWTVVTGSILGFFSIALSFYILLTLLFVNAVEYPLPDRSIPTSQNTTLTTTSVTTTTVTTEATAVLQLYIDPDPNIHPDVLGLREQRLSSGPFSRQNEVTRFVLWNFLNDRFEFELSLTEEFAVSEGAGYAILSDACEVAMSYYLFSAYDTIHMFTVPPDDEGIVQARIKLEYSEPGFDQLAREAACRFIRRNPVPLEGWTDIEREKAYAKKIHDYLARRNTYSPVGYDPDAMLGMGKYEACQEAYNALVSQDEMTVCAGYARAFALIAQYADINAVWILGNEEEATSHAWNMIYPCDGSEPVLVDVTWDDTSSEDEPGQVLVEDIYFYLPVSPADEHLPSELFIDFLNEMNGMK